MIDISCNKGDGFQAGNINFMMLVDSDCNYFLYHSLLPSLLLSWSSLDLIVLCG